METDKEILDAIRRNDLPGVANAIAAGIDYRREPFLEAVRLGQTEIVHYMISVGLDIHLNKEQPLRLASSLGHTDIVRELLNAGANPRVNDHEALIEAVRGGYLEIVYLLMMEGARPGARNNEPLLIAIEKGDYDVFKALLEEGADARAREDAPLLLAARLGDLDMIQDLIGRGAHHELAAEEAIRNGKISAAYLLYQSGFPLDPETFPYPDLAPFFFEDLVPDGRIVRSYVNKGDQDAIFFLIQRGGRLSNYRGVGDDIFELFLSYGDITGDTRAIRSFFEGRYRINDNLFRTFIDTKTFQHIPQDVFGNLSLPQQKELIELGYRFDPVESINRAVREGNLPALRFFHSLGGNIRNRGDWPLREASRLGHTDIVAYLLSYGANPYRIENEAIRHAIEQGRRDIYVLFRQRGYFPQGPDWWDELAQMDPTAESLFEQCLPN